MNYYVVYQYIVENSVPEFRSVTFKNIDFNPFTINGIEELRKKLIKFTFSDRPEDCRSLVIFNIIPLEDCAETPSKIMQNCMGMLIQPDTFIEGISFLADHYDDLYCEFVSGIPNCSLKHSDRDPFYMNVEKFTLKAAIRFSSENDIKLTCSNELLEILNTKEFLNFALSSQPLSYISESEKNEIAKQAIGTLRMLFINFIPL